MKIYYNKLLINQILNNLLLYCILITISFLFLKSLKKFTFSIFICWLSLKLYYRTLIRVSFYFHLWLILVYFTENYFHSLGKNIETANFRWKISENKAMIYGIAYQFKTKIFFLHRPKCYNSKMKWKPKDCVHYLFLFRCYYKDKDLY